MNPYVGALMIGITLGVLGILLFALEYDHPGLLAVLVCAVTVAFAPWHRMR